MKKAPVSILEDFFLFKYVGKASGYIFATEARLAVLVVTSLYLSKKPVS